MASDTGTSVAVVPLDDGGLIAGIVVFVIVFVGLIAVLVVLFRRRAQQSKPEPGISLNSTTTTTSTTSDTLSNASMLTATEQIYGSSRFAQLE
jgi:heme/copper-type cytochrome/quinol oxidase subunit 2